MNIEVELRSFISKEKYEELINFFKANAKLLKDDYQETFYFNCDEDLRIQRNKFYSKIWFKKGKLHDDHREEIEIKTERDQFEQLEKLFLAMGLDVDIKWFRNRHQFDWNGITVCLDYTKGFGHIIELEIMSNEEEKETKAAILRAKLNELNIPHTPKEEFNKQYNYYKENWKELTR